MPYNTDKIPLGQMLSDLSTVGPKISWKAPLLSAEAAYKIGDMLDKLDDVATWQMAYSLGYRPAKYQVPSCEFHMEVYGFWTKKDMCNAVAYSDMVTAEIYWG